MEPEKHPSHPHNHAHHPSGLIGWIAALFHWHGHGHEHSSMAADPAVMSNEAGIRTIWLALLALGLTTLIQIVIVAASGSVALLADTIHNIGDTLNSIPLLIAFYLARRAAT